MGETTDAAQSALTPTVDMFPKAEVEACLVAELIAAAKSEAEIKEIEIPSSRAELGAMTIAIDSLVVVDLLVALEPILGFDLKNSVVRAGGYTSVNGAKSHLLPRIAKEWIKQKGKTG